MSVEGLSSLGSATLYRPKRESIGQPDDGQFTHFSVGEDMKFQLQTLESYSDEALLAEMRRVADALDGQRLTIKSFDSLARVHSTTLRDRFGSWHSALDRAGIDESLAPRFRVLTRDDVLNALRVFVSENPGESVTEQAIATRLGMHRGSITRRFGKWEEILREVGLDPVPLGRRYTDEACFENLLALWTHYGRQPNFGELNQPPSVVGSKAYIRRWRGWRAALSAFVTHANELTNPLPPVTSPTPSSPISNDPTPKAEPGVQRSLSLALRYKILVRDKFRCLICGASPAKDVGVDLHVDHIHPWSCGGQNVEENLRTLCSKCNLGKGAKLEAGSAEVGENVGSAVKL